MPEASGCVSGVLVCVCCLACRAYACPLVRAREAALCTHAGATLASDLCVRASACSQARLRGCICGSVPVAYVSVCGSQSNREAPACLLCSGLSAGSCVPPRHPHQALQAPTANESCELHLPCIFHRCLMLQHEPRGQAVLQREHWGWDKEANIRIRTVS